MSWRTLLHGSAAARRAPLWGFAVAFVVQAGLLGWMVADRALLIARGTEIRLDVVPVDPRDLLRGDYVILAYPISSLRIEDAATPSFVAGDTVYVPLAPTADGGWTAGAPRRERGDGATVLRGTVEGDGFLAGCTAPCRSLRVSYGLEQFFVPEGAGRDLERLRTGERLQVDAAVAESGRAALKRLLVDGAVRYEEDLF